MKKTRILIFFLFLNTVLFGQGLKLSCDIGYGFYELSDLKYLQHSALYFFIPVPIESVETFPNNIFYSGSMEYLINRRNLVGINGAYYSTGGRNHIQDYSGEIRWDMPLSGYKVGIQYKNLLVTFNKFSIYGEFSSGVIFSKLKINLYNNVPQIDINSFSSYYKGKNLFLEPALGFIYEFSDKWSVDLCFGYEWNYGGKLHYKNEKDSELTTVGGNPIQVNWKGYRSVLGISYNILWN